MRGAAQVPYRRSVTVSSLNAGHGTSVSALHQDGPVKNSALDLGCSSVEWLRLRTLADFELKFQLADGSEGSLPCHRALLAQSSHVIRCVCEKELANGFVEQRA